MNQTLGLTCLLLITEGINMDANLQQAHGYAVEAAHIIDELHLRCTKLWQLHRHPVV
jgi:hypothetical protein